MSRRFFLILFSAIMGITIAPEMLAVADTKDAIGVDFRAVETVEIPETPETGDLAGAAGGSDASDAGAAALATPAVPATPAAPALKNYTITHFVADRAEYVATANNLSGTDIYKFRKLVYAHNRPYLFASITTMQAGEIFTLTEGGATRTYRVAEIAVYNLVDGALNGDRNLMQRVAYSALGHDAALMTCYGAGDGQRFVVFADAV